MEMALFKAPAQAGPLFGSNAAEADHAHAGGSHPAPGWDGNTFLYISLLNMAIVSPTLYT